VSAERRRLEALGVGLAAVALLVGLALVSGMAAGPGQANLVGSAGAAIHGFLVEAFGPAALLVVALPLVWSLACFGLADSVVALRWSGLASGLLIGLPILAWLAGGEEIAAWWGRTGGGALASGFGRVGSALIVAAGLVAVTVLTLGWSPVSGLGGLARGLASGGRSLRGAAGRTVGLLRRGADRLAGRSGGGGAENPWEAAALVHEGEEEGEEDAAGRSCRPSTSSRCRTRRPGG